MNKLSKGEPFDEVGSLPVFFSLVSFCQPSIGWLALYSLALYQLSTGWLALYNS